VGRCLRNLPAAECLKTRHTTRLPPRRSRDGQARRCMRKSQFLVVGLACAHSRMTQTLTASFFSSRSADAMSVSSCGRSPSEVGASRPPPQRPLCRRLSLGVQAACVCRGLRAPPDERGPRGASLSRVLGVTMPASPSARALLRSAGGQNPPPLAFRTRGGPTTAFPSPVRPANAP